MENNFPEFSKTKWKPDEYLKQTNRSVLLCSRNHACFPPVTVPVCIQQYCWLVLVQGSFKPKFGSCSFAVAPAWQRWSCRHSGAAEDKLGMLEAEQEWTQRLVRKPNQRCQMLSQCRKAALWLRFSQGAQKSRRRIAEWPFCLFGWDVYQKEIGP